MILNDESYIQPTYESVYHQPEQLILHPELIPPLKWQSHEYIHRHHHDLKVERK